jgi:dTDP-glucose 4,6-dehydratase
MTDTVLVTGGAGFVFSNYIRHILETTDWTVVCIDRLDDAGSLERLADIKGEFPKRMMSHWHDLRAAIKPECLPYKFKYVIHGAAGSHVDRSTTDPMSFVFDNVVATANLLEYVRKHQPKCDKTLVFSTDEVVGSAPSGVEFDELSPMNPMNVYAATKAGGEVLAPAYANTFGMPIVVTRCTNIYGPHQANEKFVPLCIGKVQRDELVQIHALNGVPSSRYYVNVSDVCRAVSTILEKGGCIGGYGTGRDGISADEELSNLDVAQRIAKSLGKTLRYELVDFVPTRPRHDQRYAISDEKLRALGWKPEISFDDGLRALIVPPMELKSA